ncbi:MAG: SDR family NAD(P)-dependent oxidoreductase, partial [Bacteroidales bacterium]|nr:SDR family NAD(P)-dependent oxidoreductase [Bacteroidales bacterium]
VEVLVNNAGLMYCQTIAETSPRFLSLIMMVHNYTPLMLCRQFVPGMVRRGCGYVLNISSLAAWMDWPGIGMYGNTKRFVKGFSRSLRVECRGTGVSVTNAYFGAVDTPLIPLKPSLRRLARNLGVMITAEKATDKALNATFRRRKGTMPGILNRIFLPFVALMPDCVLSWALRKLGPYILMKV